MVRLCDKLDSLYGDEANDRLAGQNLNRWRRNWVRGRINIVYIEDSPAYILLTWTWIPLR